MVPKHRERCLSLANREMQSQNHRDGYKKRQTRRVSEEVGEQWDCNGAVAMENDSSRVKAGVASQPSSHIPVCVSRRNGNVCSESYM